MADHAATAAGHATPNVGLVNPPKGASDLLPEEPRGEVVEAEMPAEKLHFPSSVTTIIRRTVRADADHDYERWMHGITCAAAAFPGYLGTTILRPQDPQPARHREYTVLLNFASAAELETWMGSQVRKRHLEAASHLCLDDSEVQTLTGLERWFTLPNRAVSQPPPRYKMALLTALGLYPLLLLLSLALRPFTGSWPWPLAILLSVVLGVPLMTWAVMPGVTRLFFRWLYPR